MADITTLRTAPPVPAMRVATAQEQLALEIDLLERALEHHPMLLDRAHIAEQAKRLLAIHFTLTIRETLSGAAGRP